jgi:hypothetical protein
MRDLKPRLQVRSHFSLTPKVMFGIGLLPPVDRTDHYLLEVEWRDLAAHTEYFEPSSAYTQFMGALEPFLVDEPIVVHVPTAT